MNLVLYNLIISSVLTAVILITQIINYPLFKYVQNDFSTFHQNYVKRIGFIVAPIMVLELIIVSIMLVQDFDNNLIKFSAVLVFIIWISTFFMQVPIHNELSLNKKKNLHLLIYSNWVRVICWMLKLIISIMIFNIQITGLN
ncbi:MAG: hypothetical protein CMP56_05115 [Flavobacteriales bacterium]|nr:hypothetical protein [Flavobacteriales bacterium]